MKMIMPSDAPFIKRFAAIVPVLVLCSGCSMKSSTVRQSPGGLPTDSYSQLKRANMTDWREVLESPTAVHDPYYGKFVEKLKHSMVPTEQDAISRAVHASRSVDSRATWQVSALLRVAGDVSRKVDINLGQAGDLVWEVREVNPSIEGGIGITGLIWVSTTTGKAKVLYP